MLFRTNREKQRQCACGHDTLHSAYSLNTCRARLTRLIVLKAWARLKREWLINQPFARGWQHAAAQIRHEQKTNPCPNNSEQPIQVKPIKFANGNVRRHGAANVDTSRQVGWNSFVFDQCKLPAHLTQFYTSSQVILLCDSWIFLLKKMFNSSKFFSIKSRI